VATVGSQLRPGIERGEVYWLEILDTKGSEQNDLRPWLVVSSNKVHQKFPIFIGVPLSTQLHKQDKFRGARQLISEDRILKTAWADSANKFRRPLQGHSLALTEQVRVLSHSRIEDKAVATVAEVIMSDIEAGLSFVLDLP
jgi:mRNA-degrading endonuclease toxin of MazEF toxin-antitoxin module